MIGDGKALRVIGVDSLNLRMHSKTDFDVKLTGVYVTEGIGSNLFSLHQAQARQTIMLDKEGAHLLDKPLTFSRNEIGSCLNATLLDPTPTAGLSAVPAFSGTQPPPPVLWCSTPPPSCSQPPCPFGCPFFRVHGAEPSGLAFEPFSHRRVERGMAADLGFPPAVSGTIPTDSRLPPTGSGAVPTD